MNQNEPMDTEKFVSWKQCVEIFEQYHFRFQAWIITADVIDLLLKQRSNEKTH